MRRRRTWLLGHESEHGDIGCGIAHIRRVDEGHAATQGGGIRSAVDAHGSASGFMRPDAMSRSTVGRCSVSAGTMRAAPVSNAKSGAGRGRRGPCARHPASRASSFLHDPGVSGQQPTCSVHDSPLTSARRGRRRMPHPASPPAARAASLEPVSSIRNPRSPAERLRGRRRPRTPARRVADASPQWRRRADGVGDMRVVERDVRGGLHRGCRSYRSAASRARATRASG